MKTDALFARIRLREIAEGDEKRVNRFFDAMGGESRALFNRRDYNRKKALRACIRRDTDRLFYMAELDEEMAGYVFFLDWDTTVPELGIALRDELQGQGLGKHLMEFAVTLSQNAGKGGIQLTTHVANLRAQALYEAAGFVCKGLCKNGTELFYLLRF